MPIQNETQEAEAVVKAKFTCEKDQLFLLHDAELRAPTPEAVAKAQERKREASDKAVYEWHTLDKNMKETGEIKVTAVSFGKQEFKAFREKVRGLLQNPDAETNDAIGCIFACRMMKLSNTVQSLEKIVPVKLVQKKGK